MRSFSRGLRTTMSLIAVWSGTVSMAAAPEGDLALPEQVTVFGPFGREDGVPAPELLRRVPETLQSIK